VPDLQRCEACGSAVVPFMDRADRVVRSAAGEGGPATSPAAVTALRGAR
jgi:hypothetical protein